MKKIAIFVQPGIPNFLVNSVTEALNYFLTYFGLTKTMEVINFGNWKSNNFSKAGKLLPRESLEWLIGIAYSQRGLINERSLNTATLRGELPIINMIYDFSLSILITDYILYHPIQKLTFGTTGKFDCSILSTDFVSSNQPSTAAERLYYLALHEIGHLFGVGLRLEEKARNILGNHCPDENCIMHSFFLPVSTIEKVRTGYLISPYKFCWECEQEAKLNVINLKVRLL